MLDRLKKKARHRLKAGSGSHDWEHTERVCRLAMAIGRREKADLGILSCASLLHDIGRPEADRSRGRKDHAKLGALLAGKWMKQEKMPDDRIAAVVHDPHVDDHSPDLDVLPDTRLLGHGGADGCRSQSAEKQAGGCTLPHQ